MVFFILFWYHGPLFLFLRFWFLVDDSQHFNGIQSGLSLFVLFWFSPISLTCADHFYFADRVCDPGPGSGLFLSGSFFCSLISLNRSNALEPDRTALLRFEQTDKKKDWTKKQTEKTEQANTKNKLVFIAPIASNQTALYCYTLNFKLKQTDKQKTEINCDDIRWSKMGCKSYSVKPNGNENYVVYKYQDNMENRWLKLRVMLASGKTE